MECRGPLGGAAANGDKLNFFPLSKFAIFQNLLTSNDTLDFPEYLYVSRNHFDIKWSISRTLRRIKNVIAIMEIDPSSKGSSMFDGFSESVSKTLGFDTTSFTPEQERHLRRCFTIADVGSQGSLQYPEFLNIVKIMGVDPTTANNVYSKYEIQIASTGLTFAVFKTMVFDLEKKYRQQGERFYVLLSLEEAEHLRGVLHARDSTLDQLIPMEKVPVDFSGKMVAPTSVALWVLSDERMRLLASSKGYKPQTEKGPHQAMVSSYRFINSDIYYSKANLVVLLRVLETNTCEMREAWWNGVRACRRRRQIGWDNSVPISTIWQTKSEVEFLEYEITTDRIRQALAEKGMLVFDAFRAFNSSNSGTITCSEMYGGLSYLGVPFTADEIYSLINKIAVQHDGLVSYPDFKRVFQH